MARSEEEIFLFEDSGRSLLDTVSANRGTQESRLPLHIHLEVFELEKFE
jgi:hypothetical protein